MRVILTVLLFFTTFAWAGERSITITGRNAVIVTTQAVRLGDIAEILSKDATDDDAVIGLKKLFISASPQPGNEITLSAAEILSKLRDQGVNINNVTYTLPRIVTVTRAGREVRASELESVISQFLQIKGRDVAVKQMLLEKAPIVDPSASTFSVTGETQKEGGKRLFTISTGSEIPQTFQVEALLEEFRDLPVARRSITKGAVIQAEDIGRARFNIAMIPKDFSEAEAGIVGLAASNDINSGEVFRASKLARPIAIRSGEKVIMKFQGDFLEVTATGVAAEDGAIGQEIRIKNDTSKKVVTGTIVEPGLARVK